MRIVSLSPFITEVLDFFELLPDVVGADPESLKLFPASSSNSPPKLISCAPSPADWSAYSPEEESLGLVQPDVVLSSPDLSEDFSEEKVQRSLSAAQQRVISAVGKTVTLKTYAPTTLPEIFECFEKIGRDVGKQGKGLEIHHLLEAQFKDWYDNFYDRMKRKRVTFLSSITPFHIAGRWIPDLIKLASCTDQHNLPGEPDREVSWGEIVSFKPDVIVIAPRTGSLEDSYRTFLTLEKQPGWEEIPAVKRGEVIFCEGSYFYRPGLSLRRGMGVLCSALAGLDSGYITPRDSFQRLRWLELQRHRFAKQ